MDGLVRLGSAIRTPVMGGQRHNVESRPAGVDDDCLFVLTEAKKAIAIYLMRYGQCMYVCKRLFRGPNTNDMKK